MKTAISIPNNIYESAEKLADQLGQSRSQLYTTALTMYVAKHQSEDITKKLNEVYDEIDSSIEPGFITLQANRLAKNKW